MTSRERIRRVLERDRPDRVGLTFSHYAGAPRLNDVAGIGPARDANRATTAWADDGTGGETYLDEWGCTWRRVKGKTDKGEVCGPPLRTWDDLDTYDPPTFGDPARYEHGPRVREEQAERYLLGSLHGCAFNYARYLRGFGTYLADCAESPAQIRRLNRLVNDLALAQIDLYAELGCDGVMFAEDWGTEDRLLISPAMWQKLFRPDFERLIGRAHERGLTVWMHSCGYVKDIIPSLVEIGMDVFQFDQPELSGLDFLAQFDCSYWCPVDIQKSLPTGDEALIKARAREMIATLGGRGGGFIGKDYPDNPSIGTDPLWQHWAYEVWQREGVYAA